MKFVLSQILYRFFDTFAFIDILRTCISNNSLTITLCNNVIEDLSITKIIIIRLAWEVRVCIHVHITKLKKLFFDNFEERYNNLFGKY